MDFTALVISALALFGTWRYSSGMVGGLGTDDEAGTRLGVRLFGGMGQAIAAELRRQIAATPGARAIRRWAIRSLYRAALERLARRGQALAELLRAELLRFLQRLAERLRQVVAAPRWRREPMRPPPLLAITPIAPTGPPAPPRQRSGGRRAKLAA